jgi:hypothetical protein
MEDEAQMTVVHDAAWYARVRARFDRYESEMAVQHEPGTAQRRALIAAVLLERGFRIGEGADVPAADDVLEDMRVFCQLHKIELR